MDPRAAGGDGLPIGFAHRGACAEMQENTLPSFARALALGSAGLESDVWLSLDGVAVLDHDGLIGSGWRRRPISAVARADLPPHIPALEELYGSCGADFELSLDLKDRAAAGAVLDVARRAGALDRLWLCHPDPTVLAAWRSEAPSAGAVHSTGLRAISGDVAGAAGRLSRAGISALNLRSRAWTADRVAAVHASGVLAFAWDAHDDDVLDRMLDAGVDAVYSDHVDRMLAALARQRL